MQPIQRGMKREEWRRERESDWKREMVSERNIGWWRERQMETKKEREQLFLFNCKSVKHLPNAGASLAC